MWIKIKSIIINIIDYNKLISYTIIYNSSYNLILYNDIHIYVYINIFDATNKFVINKFQWKFMYIDNLYSIMMYY